MPVCYKCKEDKPVEAFSKCKGKTGNIIYRKKCKSCRNAEHNDYMKNNPAQLAKKLEYNKQYRESNPEKMKEFRSKQKENLQKCCAKRRDNLTDGYIRNRLGLKKSDNVDPDLIEAKRTQIRLIRLLKEKGCDKQRDETTGKFN